MATVMSMHWPEVTKDQYERVRQEVGWETDVPSGAKFHVAWFGEDGFRVLDIWDARESFESFVQKRLMPGVEKIGVEGAPRVMYGEVQAIFAPDI